MSTLFIVSEGVKLTKKEAIVTDVMLKSSLKGATCNIQPFRLQEKLILLCTEDKISSSSLPSHL